MGTSMPDTAHSESGTVEAGQAWTGRKSSRSRDLKSPSESREAGFIPRYRDADIALQGCIRLSACHKAGSRVVPRKSAVGFRLWLGRKLFCLNL